MIIQITIILIILIFICLVLTGFLMYDLPILAAIFATVGMVFSVVATYGMLRIDWFYIGYNNTFGNTSVEIHSTFDYGTPWAYVFVLMFFIHLVLFVYCGFRKWQLVLDKKEEEKNKLKEE